MTLHFSDLEEFLEELAFQAPCMDQPVVRATSVYYPGRQPPERWLWAGFVVGPTLVEVEQFLGYYLSDARDPESLRAEDRYRAALGRITFVAGGMHFQVRAGRYREGGG